MTTPPQRSSAPTACDCGSRSLLGKKGGLRCGSGPPCRCTRRSVRCQVGCRLYVRHDPAANLTLAFHGPPGQEGCGIATDVQPVPGAPAATTQWIPRSPAPCADCPAAGSQPATRRAIEKSRSPQRSRSHPALRSPRVRRQAEAAPRRHHPELHVGPTGVDRHMEGPLPLAHGGLKGGPVTASQRVQTGSGTQRS